MTKRTFEVEADEKYPVYSLHPSYGPLGRHKVPSAPGAGQGWIMRTRVEMSEADYAEWQRVEKEYRAWQDKIEQMFLAADAQHIFKSQG